MTGLRRRVAERPDTAPAATPGKRTMSKVTLRQQVGELVITLPTTSTTPTSSTSDPLLEESPEEMDDDALRDPDDPNESDEVGSRRVQRLADIVFSRPAPRRAPRLPVGTHLRSGRATSAIAISVRGADPMRVVDGATLMDAQLYETRLEAVAEVLLERQAAAILAPSLTRAFFALEPLTQDEVAAAVDRVDGPWLSKRNGLLVSCPWGTMPIEFFFWRKPDMAEEVLRAVHRMGRLLPDHPMLSDGDAARHAFRDLGIVADRHFQDSARKLVPSIRAVLDHRDLVLAHRTNLPDVDDRRLSTLIFEGADLKEKRLETIVRMAIVGAFEEEWP